MKKLNLNWPIFAVAGMLTLSGCVTKKYYVQAPPPGSPPPVVQVPEGQTPPPPPKEVVVVAPGPDYVWTPGYYT